MWHLALPFEIRVERRWMLLPALLDNQMFTSLCGGYHIVVCAVSYWIRESWMQAIAAFFYSSRTYACNKLGASIMISSEKVLCHRRRKCIVDNSLLDKSLRTNSSWKPWNVRHNAATDELLNTAVANWLQKQTPQHTHDKCVWSPRVIAACGNVCPLFRVKVMQRNIW